MEEISELNNLSIIYLRASLVEHLFPPNIKENIKNLFLDTELNEIFDKKHSRANQVRRLLIQLVQKNDAAVTAFIEIIKQDEHCKSFLPPNALSILGDLKKLQQLCGSDPRPKYYSYSYFQLPILPFENYIQRPVIRDKVADWILQKRNPSTFQGNDTSMDPLFLTLYGESGWGKTLFSAELFENKIIRETFPKKAVLKYDYNDMVGTERLSEKVSHEILANGVTLFILDQIPLNQVAHAKKHFSDWHVITLAIVSGQKDDVDGDVEMALPNPDWVFCEKLIKSRAERLLDEKYKEKVKTIVDYFQYSPLKVGKLLRHFCNVKEGDYENRLNFFNQNFQRMMDTLDEHDE